MDKKVTIRDIAEALKVSTSTVSKALSQATDINKKTREKILKYASEQGYPIKNTKPQLSESFAVFVEGIDYTNINQFAHEVILGFQMAAGKLGYGVNIIADNNEMEFGERLLDITKKHKYEGFLFIGFKPDSPYTKHIKGLGAPCVIIDNYFDSNNVIRIGSDSESGIKKAVSHLVKLGHKKIVFLGGDVSSVGITTERKNFFLQALIENNLEVSEENIFYSGYYDNYDEAVVEDIINMEATAIVCASDFIAIRTMDKLKALGLSIPVDISVVGFDDIPASRYCNPTLTTIAQDRLQLGKCSFETLISYMGGTPIRNVLLRTEFIERESTGAAK